MRILIIMAYRNILRNSRRNLFTILSIAFGLAFLFWIQSILNGHNENMIRTITKTFTGEIQVHHKDYLEDRQVQFDFEVAPSLKEFLNEKKYIWSKRVYFPAIISAGDLSFPIYLVGLEPEREKNITSVYKNLVEGDYLQSKNVCEESTLLVSRSLSTKLGASIGDRVVLLGQDADGSLGNDLFQIVGLTDSKSRDFDKMYVFTPASCAQKIAAVSGVHELLIKESVEQSSFDELSSFVSGLGEKELKASTWKDIVPGVAGMIEFNGAMSALITLILFTVISLGVINAVLMNIFERIREIGIMLAIGTTPFQVIIIILFESFFIAFWGGVLGTVAGYVAIFYHQSVGFDLSPFLGTAKDSVVGFSFETMVRPVIDWLSYLKLLLIEVVFVVLAGAYPAVKASRIKPIETIRG